MSHRLQTLGLCVRITSVPTSTCPPIPALLYLPSYTCPPIPALLYLPSYTYPPIPALLYLPSYTCSPIPTAGREAWGHASRRGRQHSQPQTGQRQLFQHPVCKWIWMDNVYLLSMRLIGQLVIVSLTYLFFQAIKESINTIKKVQTDGRQRLNNKKVEWEREKRRRAEEKMRLALIQARIKSCLLTHLLPDLQ